MTHDYLIFAVFLAAGSAAGQTAVDLSTQTKNVDFSNAARTRPMKTGLALPAACSAGEFFFRLEAPAGRNVYICTAGNLWTELTSAALPAIATADSDKVLSNDGESALWVRLGGDVSGPPSAIAVVKLQGRSVSSQAPLSGDMLRWNPAAERWEPHPAPDPYIPDHGIVIAGSTIAVDDMVTPVYYTGQEAPDLDCTAGRDYYLDISSQELYYCGATGTWRRLSRYGHTHAAGDVVSGTFQAARLPLMSGDSGSGGAAGAVPAASAGDAAAGKFLKADGTWTVPPQIAPVNPQIDFQPALTPVSIADASTDYLLYQTSGVQLAAGECIRISAGYQHASGVTPLYFALQAGGSDLYRDLNPTADTSIGAVEFLVCNNPGTRSAQTTIRPYMRFLTSDSGPALAASSLALDTPFQLSLVVSCQTAPDSDSVTPLWWRISR